ncbi:MAG: tyrosine--tRNA ligase [Candidatus Paceibacterota bacterium]|jgi:tyrosyl-tRNA synthetase
MKTALTRAVQNIYPSRELLEKKLAGGDKLRIYLGIDPTGPTLHIGHGVVLLKLRELQDLGHQIILLIGDFTAMIGDPSDKTAARKKLTKEEVLANCKNYVAQAGKIIDVDKTEIRFNSEWLGKMNFADVLELAANFTVQQMLERDMFEKRLENKQPIYLHEFFYPAMQGYDSEALRVDAEVGGNDQTFNMLAGRTLMSKQGKEKFVMSVKLLTDPTGKKMGKSEGNMVTMEDSPESMFGKVMSWPDTMMETAFEICTRVPADEYKKITEGNPLEAKLALAGAITKIYHGETGAKEGREYFAATIQNKELPTDITEVTAEKGDALSEIILKHKLVASKGEFTRLVKEGGVQINGEKLHDPFYKISEPITVKIGKLRYLKILV